MYLLKDSFTLQKNPVKEKKKSWNFTNLLQRE
jgi:hypothetical protein